MLYQVFQYSNLLPFLAGMLLMGILPKSLRIIALIPFIDFIGEFINNWAIREFHNNMWFFDLYRIVEVFLIAAYFHYQIENHRHRLWNWIISISLMLFGLLSSHFWIGWDQYNQIFFILSGFWYILLCLLIYYQMMLKFPIPGLEKDPFFFINNGLFIFFCVSFIAFATRALLLTIEDQLWKVFWLSRIFRNIFITIGFLVFYFSWKKQPAK